MANTRGVFRLRKISEEKIPLDEWVDLDNVWHYPSGQATPNTGYYAGGSPGPGVSIVDKIDFTSDTTARVPSANLTQQRLGLAATSSVTDAYFAAGRTAPSPYTYHSLVEKTTYASDTTARAPGADLSLGRELLGAAGNITDGYFGGGRNPSSSPVEVSTMDKVTYSSDTTAAVPGGVLSHPRRQLAGTGNADAGYFGGGLPGPGTMSTVDKLTYASDTTAAVPGAALSVERQSLAATGNSTDGYFGGGGPAPGTFSTMDKLTYASDTTAAVPSANLSAAKYALSATGNSTAGYFGGRLSKVDKLTYSTDTTVLLPSGADLSSTRYNLSAASGRANAVAAAPSAPATRFSDGAGPSPNTGYFGGGFNPPAGGATLSTMDKIDFASDTRTTVSSAALSAARASFSGATGNSTDGYFGGGYSSSVAGAVSTMDKVTYASDTTAAVPGAFLTAARQDVTATGTTTAGYFGGGRPGPVSIMDKLTYSTDTTARVPGADLSAARRSIGATGNTTAGYFGGGNVPGDVSRMDKLTYSTETVAFTPGANLSANRYGVGATGDASFGYFGGGYAGVSGFSTVDKVTYSSDTTAAVPGANLSVKRSSPGATGNSTAGYFMCGDSFPSPSPSNRYPTSVDKLSYSTETSAVVPGAEGSVTRFKLGAASARANALPVTEPPTPTPSPSTTGGVPNII